MPTLSLAMIVKNEEKNLSHCLASVRNLVDEMVVVDTGSTDGTVALAQSFGARIGDFPWTGDFAAARNESLRLCTGDWVLVMDADEAVDVLDHSKIREAIAQETPVAYNIISRNYSEIAGSVLMDQVVIPNNSDYAEGANYPYYGDAPNLRLFRRYPDLRYEGRVHEVLVPYFTRRNLPMGALDAVIHHYGKVDYERERQKLSFYLELAEKDAATHPLNPQCQFNLMIQAYAAGKWGKAISAGVAFTRLSRWGTLMVYNTVGMGYQQQSKHQDAVACFETVLRNQPDHALAMNHLAVSLQALGRSDEARLHLDEAQRVNAQFGPAYFALAELEEKCERIPEARDALLAGLKALPDHERMHFALVQLDLRHQMEAQAASDAWAALAALPKGGGGYWHALVAGFLLKSGHTREGRTILDGGLLLFPEHQGLRRLLALMAPLLMGLLSLSMIVRDEAGRLGACLASVRDLVDEVVILDTGSVDGTVAVAESFGARIRRFTWKDDFAAARNESLRHCTGDWILVLDADERLDPGGVTAIRKALSRTDVQGFLLTVRNHLPSGAYLGIHGGAMPNPGVPGTEHLAYMTEFPALRLVRRHERMAYSGRIHELLDPAFEALGWRAAPLEAVIHHFGKAEPEREQAKQDTYFRIAQTEAFEHPFDPRAQYNLLQEAAMVEAWVACAGAAQAFLRLQPKAPLKVYWTGARALRALGQMEEATAMLDQAPGTTGSRAALLTAKAELWLADGQNDRAASAFLEAIEQDPHFTLPFLRMGQWLREKGQGGQARGLLQAGLDQNPKDLLLWEALVGLAASEGDLSAAARDAWDALRVFPQGGRGLWHQMVAHALLQGGNPVEASAVVARGLTTFPDDPDLKRLSADLPPTPRTEG